MSTLVWLEEGKSASFGGDKVRAELSPQMLAMECNDANLSDMVTMPHYRIGTRDAKGRLIRPDDVPAPFKERYARQVEEDIGRGLPPLKVGDTMHVLDWRAKHKPKAWRLYVKALRPIVRRDKDGLKQFIDEEYFKPVEPLDGIVDQAEAFAAAEKLAAEV